MVQNPKNKKEEIIMKYKFCSLTAFIISFLLVNLLSSADIVKYDDLDEKPQILQSAQPKYPEEARKNGLVGTAFVEVLVDEYGKVTSSKIKKSSGYKLLDDASIGVKMQAKKRAKVSPINYRDIGAYEFFD